MISDGTTTQAPPSKGREAIIQTSLACLMMFITGSSFSLGVFTVVVEQHATPKGALDGVWPSAMGIMHFVSAPIMIFTGIFLDAGKTLSTASRPLSFAASKTDRVRILATLSALSYAIFAFAGLGASRSSPALVRLAVGTQSIPLGINYLLTTELLVAWVPDRPGLAVGCGQMAFGLGSITLAAVFHNFIDTFNAVTAIYITSAMLTIAVLPSILLRWPKSSSIHASEADEEEAPALVDSYGNGEDTPLFEHGEQGVKLSWHKLMTLRSFWLYIAIVFTAGAGYAFVPYFFKLGHLFGQDMSFLVRIYQITSFTATILGLFGSMWTDSLGFGDGYWYSGAKNLCMGLLALQTTLFLTLAPLSSEHNFTGFVIVVSILIVLLATHAGCAALLARDLFGPANSCLVFGIGAGLAMGSGEGFSAELMSTVENVVNASMDSPPSAYNTFYILAAVWSFGGLLSIVAVERCAEAFKLSAGQASKQDYSAIA